MTEIKYEFFIKEAKRHIQGELKKIADQEVKPRESKCIDLTILNIEPGRYMNCSVWIYYTIILSFSKFISA